MPFQQPDLDQGSSNKNLFCRLGLSNLFQYLFIIHTIQGYLPIPNNNPKVQKSVNFQANDEKL